MSAGEIQICNSALDILGALNMVSFSDQSKEARLCKRNYPLVRDSCLEFHYWNWAMARKELALIAGDAGTPLFEFSFAHQLPADCLRIRRTQNEGKWRREGSTIVSHSEDMKVEYISKITDTTQYSSRFRELLAYKLASKLAYPLVQSVNLGEKLEAKADKLLRDAASMDGQEGTPDNFEEDVWLNSRLAGPGRLGSEVGNVVTE